MIVIIGSGLAGLGAARFLKQTNEDFVILESDSSIGGLAQTDDIQGFSLDRCGHFLHFRTEEMFNFFSAQSVKLVKIKRSSSILSRGKNVPYPMQYNLWAYDNDLRKQVCIEQEARVSYLEHKCDNLADRAVATWGPTLTDLFFRPYNEKLWGRSLESLPVDCLGRFPPSPDIEQIKRGCQKPLLDEGYNAHFWYPQSGRISDWVEALAEPISSHIRNDWNVSRIDLEKRIIRGQGGKAISYKKLISTIPLTKLLALTNLNTTTDQDLFSHTVVANIRVGLVGQMQCPFHWVYLPDSDIYSYRVGFPKNVNSLTCPPGCISLSLEYTRTKENENLSKECIAENAVKHLARAGLISAEKVLFTQEAILNPAYVIYRSPNRPAFYPLLSQLNSNNIFLAGRFGTWDYLSMEESFLSGHHAAANSLLPITASKAA